MNVGKVSILQNVVPLSWPVLSFSHSPSCLSETKQTNLRTTPAGSCHPLHSLCQQLPFLMQVPVFSCQNVILQESRDAQTFPFGKATVVYPCGGNSLVDMGSEGLVKSLKSGPVGYVTAPATHHQLEERRWAKWGGIKEYLVGENKRDNKIRRYRT